MRSRLQHVGLLDPRAWLVLGLAAAWSVAAGASTSGAVVLPYGGFPLLVIPVLLGGGVLLARRPVPAAVRAAAIWMGVGAAALVGAVLLIAFPFIAVILPGALITGLVLARYPAAGVTLAFAFTGTHGTLTALLGFPVGESVDLLLVGLWVGAIFGYLFGARDRPVLFWPGIVAAAAYVFLTGAEILTAEGGFIGLHAFRTTAWYMLTFLLVAYAAWGPECRVRIARGVVLASALVGGYATLRWFIGPADAERDLVLINPAITNNFVNGELRLFGSLTSGSELGVWTSVAVPFCCAFALTFGGRWRLVAIAAAGLCMFALLGSELRVALIGVAAGLALTLVLYQLSRGFPGLHLGFTLAAVLGVALVGFAVFSQTAGRNEASAQRYVSAIESPTEDPSYQARVFKWRTALAEIDDHPFGHGLGTAGRINDQYGRFASVASSNLDNSYLKVAYEQGFAVMVFFAIALVLLLLGMARRAITTTVRIKAGLAIGACGSLVAFMVAMFAALYIEGLPALAAWVIIGVGAAQFAFRDEPDLAEPAPQRG